MILIVAALKAELLPLIEYFTINQKETIASGTLYHTKIQHLLRTGVGMQKAREVLDAYLDKYNPTLIINIGMAGSLNSRLSIGTILEAKSIQNEKSDIVYPVKLKSNQHLFEQANLLTVKEAVLDVYRNEDLFAKFKADMVDMEAFALAELSQQRKIDFHCIKIISDQADENAKKDFENNYKILVEKLCGKFIELNK